MIFNNSMHSPLLGTSVPSFCIQLRKYVSNSDSNCLKQDLRELHIFSEQTSIERLMYGHDSVTIIIISYYLAQFLMPSRAEPTHQGSIFSRTDTSIPLSSRDQFMLMPFSSFKSAKFSLSIILRWCIESHTVARSIEQHSVKYKQISSVYLLFKPCSITRAECPIFLLIVPVHQRPSQLLTTYFVYSIKLRHQ